jgi:hypothetical protein
MKLKDKIILECLRDQRNVLPDICLNDEEMTADIEKQYGCDIQTVVYVLDGLISEISGMPKEADRGGQLRERIESIVRSSIQGLGMISATATETVSTTEATQRKRTVSVKLNIPEKSPEVGQGLGTGRYSRITLQPEYNSTASLQPLYN